MTSLILKGGWVMAPIIAGSVVALTLVLERLWFFWTIRLDAPSFGESVFRLVKAKDFAGAARLCERMRGPLAEIFRVGLEHAGEPVMEIDRVMEREGNRQIQEAEKNLNFLLVIIGIEPLLGFLGTILGLIRAFMAWETLGASVTVSALAAGIYQAMITTAAGLIVAIPYFVVYHAFVGRVNSLSQDLTHFGGEFVSVLAKTGRAGASS
ncbi:MAG: MotA/TolQ/ExbB proton channel family protein [Candidatus Omnitrophica bacterium]|nr:MotA/TolQ/ExbB proton channel family protein [Candidatus Omnitrophota bacterium]